MPPKSKYRLDLEQFYPLLTAASQAIAGRNDLSIQTTNLNHDNPLRSTSTISLTKPVEDNVVKTKHMLRGQADLTALALKHHHHSTHLSQRPIDKQAAEVYDALEHIRLEALGSKDMTGMQHNLQQRLESHCIMQGYHRMSDQTKEPPLADIIAMIMREKLTGREPPRAIRTLVNTWRPWVENGAMKHLKGLSEHLDSQAEFASHVKRILIDLDLLEEQSSEPSAESEPSDSDNDDSNAQDNKDQEHESQQGSAQARGDKKKQKMEQTRSMLGEEDENERKEDDEDGEQRERRGHNSSMFDKAPPFHYRAYTTAFDEVITAEELAMPEELLSLRHQLDQKVKTHQAVTSRLASRLQRLLLAQQAREWLYDQEDGQIDNARLARVVTRPDVTAIYKYENDTDFRDTVITLLIDNSGSMRGRPITIAALSADILARTLERCGVKVEILGFTTRDWKGGESRKQWVANDRPAMPGRLNDLRHIIYKSADTRLGRARKNLGLMLKEGLLKENIDGEALLWAHQRLMGRTEQRKILMVISDGAPVDDSTLSINSGGYLDKHLREVIAMIEQHSDVELLAIGIGHDVRRYYQRAVTLNDVDQLGDTMLKEITQLFTEENKTRHRKPQ